MPISEAAQTALLEARALLTEVTPLKADCGRLCGAACCLPGEDGEAVGMLLFPGEAALYESASWAQLLPAHYRLGDEPGQLLVCGGHCPRAERPLACRVFPLTVKAGQSEAREETTAAQKGVGVTETLAHPSEAYGAIRRAGGRRDYAADAPLSVAVRIDARGKTLCPLLPDGLSAFAPAFVAAAQAAFSLLWAQPEHRAYLTALSALVDQYEGLTL